MSSTNDLLRALELGDESPRGIMALGACIDTFVSGGGCTTAHSEFYGSGHSRRGCPGIKCDLYQTLSWDDSTVDTLDASDGSTGVRSANDPPASPKIMQAFNFLKRRKSEEELSLLSAKQKPSEREGGSHKIGPISEPPLSSKNSKTKTQPPKSIWSSDFLAEGSETPQAQGKQSNKIVGKKPRIVTPESSTPKSRGANRSSSSTSPAKARSIWPFGRNQTQKKGVNSPPSHPEEDFSKATPLEGMQTHSQPYQTNESNSNANSALFNCFQSHEETQFWSAGCHGGFCGHDLEQQSYSEVGSIAKISRMSASYRTPPRACRDDDSIKLTPPRQIRHPLIQRPKSSLAPIKVPPGKKGGTDKEIPGQDSAKHNLPESNSFPSETPLGTSSTIETDILAKVSVEQTLEEVKAFQATISFNEATIEDTSTVNMNTQVYHSQMANVNKCEDSKELDDILGTLHKQDLQAEDDGKAMSPKNDRMGELEHQIQSLVDRIMQLENEIKETGPPEKDIGHELVAPTDPFVQEGELIIMEVKSDYEEDHDSIDVAHNQDEKVDKQVQALIVRSDEKKDAAQKVKEAKSLEEAKEPSDLMQVNVLPPVNVNEKQCTDSVEDCVVSAISAEESSYTGDDGMEVDLLDFVPNDDEANESLGAGVIEDPEEEGVELNVESLLGILRLKSEECEERDEEECFVQNANVFERCIHDEEMCLKPGVENNTPSNDDHEELNSHNDAIPTTIKKRRGIVGVIKKKFLGVSSKRAKESGRKSTKESQEVKPMTGVYESYVLSDGIPMTLPDSQKRLMPNPASDDSTKSSCEQSFATGMTTLPCSNVMESLGQ